MTTDHETTEHPHHHPIGSPVDLLLEPDSHPYPAEARSAIWREGRRRKARARTRSTLLLAAAASIAWISVGLLLWPDRTDSAVAVTAPPTPPPTPVQEFGLQRVRTPSPDAATPAWRVRTGDVAVRVETIPRDGLLNSMPDITAVLVGAADNRPRLYLQPPGSFDFVPVN